ncbi:hypothetical protein CR513_62270, partial [Mucuna pruriens]
SFWRAYKRRELNSQEPLCFIEKKSLSQIPEAAWESASKTLLPPAARCGRKSGSGGAKPFALATLLALHFYLLIPLSPGFPSLSLKIFLKN